MFFIAVSFWEIVCTVGSGFLLLLGLVFILFFYS